MRTSLYYLYLDMIVFGRLAAFVAAAVLVVSALLMLLCSAYFWLRPAPRLITMSQRQAVAHTIAAPVVAGTAVVAPVSSPLAAAAAPYVYPVIAYLAISHVHVFQFLATATLELTAPNGPPLSVLPGLAAVAIIVPIIFVAPSTKPNQIGDAMRA